MRTDFAAIGYLLSHRARSVMLDALLDGRALTAGELGRLAGVPASSASEHLAILLRGGLVQVRASGRYRYYALTGPKVASALEALGEICPVQPGRSLRSSLEADRLRFARTCYDHLAGWLGVTLLDRMLERGWLVADTRGFVATDQGAVDLRLLGIDVDEVSRGRRAFALPCLDWTERRFHLAGALGASLAALALERGWVERSTRARGLLVTDAGRRTLHSQLDIDLSTHGG